MIQDKSIHCTTMIAKERKEGWIVQPVLFLFEMYSCGGHNQIHPTQYTEGDTRIVVTCKIEENRNDIKNHCHHPSGIILFYDHCI